MASDLLPVDLLEEIFLRLDDVADLVRASAACTCFRRVVSDGRFLRRFRYLHRRPILGFLANDPKKTALFYFYPAQPPRRSAQAAACFAEAADFSFAFLPGRRRARKRWQVCDVRDGRVLLYRRLYGGMFRNLVVYDPLHRRHVQIPTIPGDLLPSAMQDGINDDLILLELNGAMRFVFDRPFLAPAAVHDDDDESSSTFRFQVMCVALFNTEVVAFVFSSDSGKWRRGASLHNPSYDWAKPIWLWYRYHVHGCVCWPYNATNVMLVFDTREMRFSMTDLPHQGIDMYKMAVEAGDDGRLGLILQSKECTTMDLYSKAKERHDIQEPEQWRHDSSIPILPGFYFAMLAGVTEGYALLLGISQDKHERLFVLRVMRSQTKHIISPWTSRHCYSRSCV